MSDERLEAIIPDRRDAKAVNELVAEIEGLLGCGNTCAVELYDRLKVIRRAVVDMRDNEESHSSATDETSIAAIIDRYGDRLFSENG